MLKHGGPWTRDLEARARIVLDLGDEHQLVATASGTAALRMAFAAAASEEAGDREAILPSYTFAATA
jgi:dTDP-4-amino-4,6-dideoxygalactose transaminase